MRKKIGIKKTKMNIFWLFLIGLLVGVVIGLRRTAPETATTIVSETVKTMENPS